MALQNQEEMQLEKILYLRTSVIQLKATLLRVARTNPWFLPIPLEDNLKACIYCVQILSIPFLI